VGNKGTIGIGWEGREERERGGGGGGERKGGRGGGGRGVISYVARMVPRNSVTRPNANGVTFTTAYAVPGVPAGGPAMLPRGVCVWQGEGCARAVCDSGSSSCGGMPRCFPSPFSG